VERDSRGILAVHRDEFAYEAAALRSRWTTFPVVRGDGGFATGWREIPYVTTPASLESLALGAIWVEQNSVAITPGVSHVVSDRCDVMRGEEVQFLGAVAAGLAPAERLLCQPGTHSKWARVQAAQILDFSTAMTGELYSLLRQHSLLAETLEGEAAIGAPFTTASVRDASRRSYLRCSGHVRRNCLTRCRPATELHSSAVC